MATGASVTRNPGIPRRLRGKTTPRLFTPPLRQLSRRTSLGYALCDFAEAIGMPFLPWQKWLAIHMLELNPDKTLRFRVVVLLVSRQNGKTAFMQVLSLFKLYVCGARLVLGTAQDLSLARETLFACIEAAEASPWLAADIADIRRANGSEHLLVGDDREITDDDTDETDLLSLGSGGRYKICAPNRKAGRGLTVDLLNIDELREWRTSAPWSALSKTTIARRDSLIFCASNAGDDGSVVLARLHEAGLSGADPATGVFEWSAEPGCELLDWKQLAQANPSLGYTLSPAALATAAVTDRAEDFRTECLCTPVPQLAGAVSWSAWQECADAGGSLTATPALRDRLAVCFDISGDSQHATLCAAAKTNDGRPRVEVVMAWKSTETARAELPALLAKLKPRTIGWYPGGPGGAFTSILRPAEAPRGTEYTDLAGGKAAEACMQLADLTRARQVLHAGQEVLDEQIKAATKTSHSDAWRFTRKGQGHCDAAYAAAGAVWLALSVPEPRRARIRILA